MSIPTNKIQAMTSMGENDTFVVDTVQGTGRVSLAAIREMLKDTFMAGNGPDGKELTESWTSLRDRIKAGDVSGIHDGDYKIHELSTGEVVVSVVSGINTYKGCGDTEIGNHVDFISFDALAGAKLFNETNTNNGTEVEPNPWRASKLFQDMNDESTGVYSTLDDELKACIIEKRALLPTRYSAAGALTEDTGWAWNSMGKLWLPTEVEVFGAAHWSQPGYGTAGGGCNLQYPIFARGAKYIIKGDGNGGSRCYWWLASAHSGSATDVCSVGGHGYASYPAATDAFIRAPLCFRIG